MLAEPFPSFTFSPPGASIYQLGTFGTARKELKALTLAPEAGQQDHAIADGVHLLEKGYEVRRTSRTESTVALWFPASSLLPARLPCSQRQPRRKRRRTRRCRRGTTARRNRRSSISCTPRPIRQAPKFVPPEERIAAFDQDGTLWVEHPIYTQVVYCLDRVPAVVEQKPELKNRRTVQNHSFRRSRGDRQAVVA